ncbi:MAG: WecB/TagA/CpsF family glycosyltransferase [Thermodesulfobacteriota bacterium]|nr:WecB/TagA/CpsF family glycosyltransferase [Thermodesulfobacteriota bacterium]
MNNRGHRYILNIRIAITSHDNALASILQWTTNPVSRYVCVSNVHMCMEAFDNHDFCQIVNNADLVVPDGLPLVWGLKALGEKHAFQVRGSDLLLKLCGEAQKRNIPIGLYGGTQDSLDDFLKFLKNEFPDLRIPFFSAPPFRELTQEEEANYVNEINASGARILFVGIGCPKQENWMAKHKDKLSCVMIGVGAAFDFFSGRKKHAPRWMQRAGLEWFFRLSSDPRRLWKRYLKHNPRFVYFFLRQWLRERA